MNVVPIFDKMLNIVEIVYILQQGLQVLEEDPLLIQFDVFTILLVQFLLDSLYEVLTLIYLLLD